MLKWGGNVTASPLTIAMLSHIFNINLTHGTLSSRHLMANFWQLFSSDADFNSFLSFRKILNPRIVLLDCPLEYKKGESQACQNFPHYFDMINFCFKYSDCSHMLDILLKRCFLDFLDQYGTIKRRRFYVRIFS